MRDVVAGLAAVVLLVVAASLGTTLRAYRRRRQDARDLEGALGRSIIIEIPGANDLVLFTEDASRFYYGERSIDKHRILAVTVLINGAPIAESRREPAADEGNPDQPDPSHPSHSSHSSRSSRSVQGARAAVVIDDRPDGIARDRWDVAIETDTDMTLIECGAIRERVSQELARAVFDAVKRELVAGHHSVSGAPPR
jgi:hypothetical protein